MSTSIAVLHAQIAKSAAANENHRRRRREQKAEIERLRKQNLALWAEVEALRARKVTQPDGKPTHCGNGHEFTPENTLIQRRGRECRACRRARQQASEERKRAKKPATEETT